MWSRTLAEFVGLITSEGCTGASLSPGFGSGFGAGAQPDQTKVMTQRGSLKGGEDVFVSFINPGILVLPGQLYVPPVGDSSCQNVNSRRSGNSLSLQLPPPNLSI